MLRRKSPEEGAGGAGFVDLDTEPCPELVLAASGLEEWEDCPVYEILPDQPLAEDELEVEDPLNPPPEIAQKLFKMYKK